MFYEWEKNFPNQPFLNQPFGDTWETYTWGESGEMARKIASALKSFNLPKGAHIGLISKNCREWVIADIAIVMAGYVSVPFFDNLTGEQLQEVIELGDVKALFVGKVEDWENTKQSVNENLPLISFPNYKGHSVIDNALKWKDIMNDFEPLQNVHRPFMNNVWSIIFTSGTTGAPKGVVINYKAIEESKWSVLELNPTKTDLDGDNRYFSYLPLNHIAERLVVEYNCFRFGGAIYFTESMSSFTQNLVDTKPTIFFAVPRILSKFQQSILSKLPQSELEIALSDSEQSEIVKKKLQAALGLDKTRALISGAAPLSESLKEWYSSIGLPITNGYGMTENCAITTILLPEEKKPGSVGKAQPRVEIKIDDETGEILMRGPFLMSGYYKRPDLTDEAIVEGWLRTGDQGRLDKDGNLFIIGRVKDTFKTAKGKFIAPAKIEIRFTKSEALDQICVVGLGCPQPLLLVNLSEVGKAKEKQILEIELTNLLDDINADLLNHEKVSTLIINNEIWSVENGLLTPTLKIKRNAIYHWYSDNLNHWHENNEKIIWE
jgi:long-subunit acyl-CoA synthetase (AMP-forming)